MAKQKEKNTPKANAEGDKLPEEKKPKSERDDMNEKQTIKGDKDAPKATAEGDKLPEKGKRDRK